MEFQYLTTSLFFFFFFAFLLFFLSKTKKKGKWPTIVQNHPNPQKLPPGPRKLPIIGNIHQLLAPLPHHTLRDLALKYGHLMHLKQGELSTIVVTSPRLAKEILKTHDPKFAARPRILALDITAYGCTGIAFSPYGDYWRQLRKICTLELLSARRIESFQYIREEEASTLVQTIYAYATSSAGSPVINLSDMFKLFANNVISRALFGKQCKDREQFVESLKEAIKYAVGMSVSDFYPSLGILSLITGLRFRLQRIKRTYDRILNDIIDEHKQKKNALAAAMMKTTTGNEDISGNDKEDFVDVLLGLQQNGDLEFPLTTDNIKAVIMDMFGGATDTSSTVLEWAMAEMIKNPRVMKKAQAEVRQVFKGKEKVEEKETNKLQYLKLVIKETLRLHPPVVLNGRECRESCEIDGYHIPANTRVLINLWAIARDPQHWDDPESFKPERFDSISTDYKGTHFDFIPFGAGRRICPGMAIAITNVVLPLAQILYYFDWELPNGMKGEDLDMTESFGATVGKKNELRLIPIPFIPFLISGETKED